MSSAGFMYRKTVRDMCKGLKKLSDSRSGDVELVAAIAEITKDPLKTLAADNISWWDDSELEGADEFADDADLDERELYIRWMDMCKYGDDKGLEESLAEALEDEDLTVDVAELQALHKLKTEESLKAMHDKILAAYHEVNKPMSAEDILAALNALPPEEAAIIRADMKRIHAGKT